MSLRSRQRTISLTDAQFKFMADVNGDGVVNNADVQALISKIASVGGSGSTSIVPRALGHRADGFRERDGRVNRTLRAPQSSGSAASRISSSQHTA